MCENQNPFDPISAIENVNYNPYDPEEEPFQTTPLTGLLINEDAARKMFEDLRD